MRKGILIIIFIIFVIGLFAYESNYRKGELLVQFSELYSSQEINNYLEINPIINAELSRMLSKRLKIWLVVLKDPNTDLEKAKEAIKSSLSLKAIQYNHNNIQLRDITPNDMLFSSQWALCNRGEFNGAYDADIDVTEAWQITTGGHTLNGKEIVIGLVDNGFQLNHPDLNFWKNIYEIPNNGIDDDNNGYIDDYDGWNAFSHSSQIIANSHGTHVSGIASAIGNNNLGISGVNINAKVLPVMGASNNEAVVVEAYAYLYEQRARYNESSGQYGAYIVSVNSSFGIDYGNPANYPIWSAMYDSLGALGILSCAATPNEDINVDIELDMPTACTSPYLITVTNTTRQDVKFNQAGFGLNSVDLGAPGTEILSTDYPSTYTFGTGTSMATPQVSGSIALLYSAIPLEVLNNYANNPSGLALLVRYYILSGTDSLSSLEGVTTTGGRLNIYKAIMKMLYNSTLNPVLNCSFTIEGHNVRLNWNIPLESPEQILLGYNVYCNNIKLNTNLITNTEYTDYNLVNDFMYHYYITALYSTGESGTSEIMDVILLGSPINLNADAGNQIVNLTWDPPLTNLRSLLGYMVYRNNQPVFIGNLLSETQFQDHFVENGTTYSYYVTANYYEGESLPSMVVTVTPEAGNQTNEIININQTRLQGNYPNPFNPGTNINFTISKNSQVKLSIYNIKGQLVKQLIDNHCKQGSYNYYWNGIGDNGLPVSSGIYYCKMQTKTYTKLHKMLLIK